MDFELWRESHPLEGPIFKLKRAQKHLETIDDYLARYDGLNPTSMVCRLNADKTFYECTLQSLTPPFLDFGIAIGEFSYQVRSALDHIIYALAEFPDSLSERERDRAERSTSFPISLVPNDTFIDSQLRYVRGLIRSDVRKIIDGVQPYTRGDRNQARMDPLALLDELNRVDKHRVFRSPEVGIHIERTNIDPGIDIMATGSAKHGEVFARIPANIDPKVEFYPRVSSEVVLPVTGPSGGKIRMESLGIIHNCVRNLILPKFVRFFDSLPASVQI